MTAFQHNKHSSANLLAGQSSTFARIGIGVRDADQALEVVGIVHINGEQADTPAAPVDTDGGLLYTKADGKPYWRSYEVSETDLTSGGMTTEQVQDIVGAMFDGNTETRIAATYEDGDGTIDLVVTDMTADTNTWRTVTAGGNTLSVSETLAFTAGTGISIAESAGAVTITNTVSDTNTFRTVTAGGNTLGGGETLAFTAGTGVSITESAGAVTITNTVSDTNTFRTVTAGGNTLGGGETLAFTAGTGVSIAESAGAVTITNTVSDTNTTYSAGNGIALSTTTFSVAGGAGLAQESGGLALSHLGIEDLSDPDADRIMFWDDDAGAMKFLVPNDNLAISGTNLNATDTNTFRTVTAGGNTLGAGETLAFTAGTGISIAESAGAVTITNTVSDTNTFRTITAGGNTLGAGETLAFTAGSGISISESAGAVTIASTGGGSVRTVTAGGNTLGAGETLAFTAGAAVAITESAGAVTITIDDPINLSQLTESTDATDDKLLLWDESTSAWKYMTLDDLQDSIDTGSAPLGLGDLSDPGGDKILFWDDSEGAIKFLQPSGALSIVTTFLNSTGEFQNVTAGGNTLLSSETLAFTEGTGIAISESGGAVTISSNLEGAELISTGEGGGSKFLREDGDGTCSWQSAAGGGDITSVVAGAGMTGGALSGDATLNVIGGDGITANADDIEITDNGVTLAKMAGLARGSIIYGDASGDPAELVKGSTNYVLTSDGTDIAWASTPGGSGEANEYSFKTISVSGEDNVVADADDDTLTLVAGTGISIATTADQITFTNTVSDTDTTYSVSCVDGDNSDEEKIRLTAGGSGSGTDDVVLEAGTGLSIARSSDKITYTNTVSDTNTTYSISCVDGDSSDEEKIRLTAGGSGSGTDDVVLEAGTGLSIARSSDKITFTNTVSDTNTWRTVTAGGNTLSVSETLAFTAGTGVAISETGGAVTIGSDLEGTELLSTGEGGGSKFLRENGDGTCGWETVSGGGGISHDGSTADGVLTYKDSDEATVEANLTFDGNSLSVTTGSASAVPLTVKGASSQSANLLLIEKSDGTDYIAVDNNGSIRLGPSGTNRIQTDNVTGTNEEGKLLDFRGGKGTGNADGGKIEFRVSPAGSSGASANAHAQALVIDSNKVVDFKIAGGAKTVTLENDAPDQYMTGTATVTVNATEWLEIKVAGNTRYIPVWS